MNTMAFVNHVKTNLKMPSVRFTGNLDADIKTVATSKASWCFMSPVTNISAPLFIASNSNPIPEPPIITVNM
jgi:hypothetical protein